jgi:ubiquinone/menaquinone biosynthesis C-methylase UbiE
MVRAQSQSSPKRRKHLRRAFDKRVRAEWKRYMGEPSRVLRRELRERFLLGHLRQAPGIILELGPGPGRFTPTLRRSTGNRVVSVDLSRESLRAARRRTDLRPGLAPVDWIQGVGEHLPLRSHSAGTVVALGNIVSFAARDGRRLLTEIGRVVKPGGVLVADFPSPAAATQEFFYVGAHQRFLRRILRRPKHYFIDQILDTGYQPLAPTRLARWEFQFYTVAEASSELKGAGFRIVDTMSVAPIGAFQNRIAGIARREKRTWRQLLHVEELVGRRPGTFETGHGFVIAAVRR